LDNLGRIAAEFAHLDRLADFDPWHPERPGRIEIERRTWIVFKLLEQPKPAIILVHIWQLGTPRRLRRGMQN
jgi:KDO2-lipid IV(A) lauroyltransferase